MIRADRQAKGAYKKGAFVILSIHTYEKQSKQSRSLTSNYAGIRQTAREGRFRTSLVSIHL